MENLNLPPFYPGQKVVSLINSITAKLKKGDIITVVTCIENPCTCGSRWQVAIKEFPSTKFQSYCPCKASIINHIGVPYMLGDSSHFAPIEEKFNHISLSKVIEIETCLVSEN